MVFACVIICLSASNVRYYAYEASRAFALVSELLFLSRFACTAFPAAAVGFARFSLLFVVFKVVVVGLISFLSVWLNGSRPEFGDGNESELCIVGRLVRLRRVSSSCFASNACH